MSPENKDDKLLHSDNTESAALIEQGIAAHQAGRFDDALLHYRAALVQAPQDAEISSLIGLSLAKSGHAGEGLPYLGRAVASEPGQAGFRLNLAEGLIALEEFDRAREELQTVITREPASAPITLAALLRLARLELALAHLDTARRVISAAETHFSKNPAVLGVKCELLVALREWPALWATALTFSQLQPSNADSWRMLARATFEQGQHRAAAEAFGRVLTLAPPRAEDVTAYAGLCMHALALDEAAVALDQAEVLAPGLAEMLSMRALLHMYFGRFDLAEAYCRRCLAVDPENASAYTTLTRLLRGQLSDAELVTLSGLAERPGAQPDHRIPAAFAVAHIHDARGDFDAAFAAYEYAQQQCLALDAAEHRAYDAAECERRIRRLMTKTLQTFPAARRGGAPRPRPIFIVGMPRSGTTLAESVLGAHSRVLACGERPLMRHILRSYLELDAVGREPDAATLAGWSSVYLQDLPALVGADHFTDKHPLNFEAIGLIAQLFPDAAVIHVRRNPVETCLSIFMQEFSKHLTFVHRLADIGHFYGQYASLMAHWERRAPGFITTIQYEDFAARFEQGAEALVAACGLDWEPGCLEFQKAPRAIATFSTVQARDPVTVRNERSLRYAAKLEPLLEALATGGVDLGTGALRAESRVQDAVPGV